MRRLRDSVSLGLFSGLMGNLSKGLFNIITWKTERNEVLYPHLASSMFFAPRRTKRRKPFLVGSLVDISMGSLLGIPLVYILKKTGKDNYRVKGAGFGALLWVVFYVVGHNLPIVSIKPRKSSSPLWAFLEHLTYGVVTSCTAVEFADPGTFPDDQLEEYQY